MLKLEDITNGLMISGIVANDSIRVVSVEWLSDDFLSLIYETNAGSLGKALLTREHEGDLLASASGALWIFDTDGAAFRLASEAHRIEQGHLFDPFIAVSSSLIQPLPHQISAVYQAMLDRHPLRFLLADDPGAGKTIMAGLLIRELQQRGDLTRCLIVCPGSLAEQWQDELWSKFHLRFKLLTHQSMQEHVGENWFQAHNLVICRLDKLSRNDELKAMLEASTWDLIVCDEAHKMSASYFGSEIKYTKRYRLGQLLSHVTRHFLLMTATPHNGKDEDFHLFMALLDGDRFEGRVHDAAHAAEYSDLMRRLVKERLIKFDGKPLFPERFAYTVNYKLSTSEASLYQAVTDYVREEFNRADQLDGKRKGTVGFALTSLQRRLASSPEAIYQSLHRRRKRLEHRLKEEKLLHRGAQSRLSEAKLPQLTLIAYDELEDAPGDERTKVEEKITEQASAAQTIAELETEILGLGELEKLAESVRLSGKDAKWDQLSRLLQDEPAMRSSEGHRHKLVIFTEFVDTLRYLEQRIQQLLGKPEAVVVIHGSMGREERRNVQRAFTQDKDVLVLIATDAAGEGINLQRAHLMVNYDLPWNPNRLEQRFGRIHRIGQREVCHLWNLVANETREGEVFERLLEKLAAEREALSGGVFDVLGRVFDGTTLRDLIIDAIRYGEKPEVRAKLNQRLDERLDHENLKQLLEDKALTTDAIDLAMVRRGMEVGEAGRLQPHYICAFFREAFGQLGGTMIEREPGRFEITHVPQEIRLHDSATGTVDPVRSKYERITFDKDLVTIDGKPLADFICPGHGLLDSVIGLILMKHGGLLKKGAVLVNEADEGEDPYALAYVEHTILQPRKDAEPTVFSRRLSYVYLNEQQAWLAGPAPYLDCRPIGEDERMAVEGYLQADWLTSALAQRAEIYALQHIATPHEIEIKQRQKMLLDKTEKEVQRQLTQEMAFWNRRYAQLRNQELKGQQPKVNSMKAKERIDELESRLNRRLEEIAQQRTVLSQPPTVYGGAIIIPGGLLRKLGTLETESSTFALDPAARKKIEELAMQAVMAAEASFGNTPQDVHETAVGHDILSLRPDGSVRFIEVKGKAKGQETVTISVNQIRTALNKAEDFVLALALVENEDSAELRYVIAPDFTDPGFDAASVNYNLGKLLAKSVPPCA